MKKPTWFLFLLLLAVSCLDQPECYLLNNNYIGIAFRVMGSNNLDSVALKNFSINGLPLQIFDLTGQTALDLSQGKKIPGLNTQLDYFLTESNLLFENAAGQKNLKLGYNRQAQYVTEECGPRYILSKLTALTTDFDSVRVISLDPTRERGGRHVEIFRCPITDTLKLVFYQLNLPAEGTAVSSKPVSLQIADVSMNNTLVNKYTDTRNATLRLPVDLTKDTSEYNFTFDELYDQSISFKVKYKRTTQERYNSSQNFNGCGTQTFVTDLDILDEYEDYAKIHVTNDLPNTTLTDPYSENINVLRCPPTNILRVSFSKDVLIKGITTDYNSNVYYQDKTVSSVDLPLNVEKVETTSTTFTIQYENSSAILIVNYQQDDLSAIFTDYCNDRKRITHISNGASTANATVDNPEIVYPLQTNITIALD